MPSKRISGPQGRPASATAGPRPRVAVPWHTQQRKGKAVIVGSVTGDFVELLGISEQQFVANPGDIAFYA